MGFDWNIVQKAAEMETVELFLNFSIMDMNRNVLLKNIQNIDKKQHDRMNQFWGDSSWEDVAYEKHPQMSLFKDERLVKQPNEAIIDGYRKRLKEIAGFKYVAEPVPMKNEKNADIYYWFFATHNLTGHKIVSDNFNKYRNREI
jgi:three-Cys-motif partner protein